ncbi:AAA family ATPase [Telluribacter sp. SYSU D00476]|uniref:AAA family ATPase n=1 Tax=Telluribacter sp. SYSU D00476 TaxID=2811430 RepID=UPI001FF6CCA1|nr:AAA family ATPase [Telluribacter sp. SYSU D00476]
MKILRIRFKNINSFYGEHPAIDFSGSPLSSTGLFIISGPTGAGKSTLLDVITLALYNEVPRLGRTISKTEIDKQGSVVNMKAADEPKSEAYAEVEYEARGKQYRSRWSIAKNRNGNWNNYQMEIAELPEGKLLDVKKLTDYPEVNAQIIGLKYEQFVKSIILAQGSFAEFLKADRNTRGKLLEDITGTHIYRSLGAAAFEKDKTWGEKLRLKEAEMNGVQLLSKEQIGELEQKRKLAEQEKTVAEGQFTYWDTEKRLWEECQNLQNRLERLGQDKVALQQQIEAFAPTVERLRQHESVSTFAGDLSLLREKQQTLEKLQQQARELAVRREQLAAERIKLLEEAAGMVGVAVVQDAFLKEVDSFENQIQALTTKIKELRAQASPLMTTLQNEVAGSRFPFIQKLPFRNIEESQSILAAEESKQQAVLSYFPTGFDADTELHALNEQEKEMIELTNALVRRRSVGEEGSSRKTKLAQAQQIVQEATPQLAQLGEELEKISQKITQLREQRDRELTRDRLDEQRKQLKAGEECPLCGSTHHPFVHEYVNNLLHLQESIKATEQEQKDLQKRERELAATLKAAQAQVATLTPELLALREQYKEADAKVNEYLTRLNLAAKADPETIEVQIKEQREQADIKKSKIRAWVQARETAETILRLRQHFTQLVHYREQVSKQQEVLRKRYAGEDVQADANRLRHRWMTWDNATRTTEEAALTNQKQTTETEQAVQVLQGTLLSNLQEVGIATVEEASSRLLPPQEYQRLKQQYDGLNDRRKQLDTQEKTLHEDLIAKNKLRKVSDVAAEDLVTNVEKYRKLRDQYLGEAATYAEQLRNNEHNIQRFAHLQSELDVLRRQRRKWELLKKYIGDATGNAFSNYAQSLTLSNLIGLANLRLRLLSDRYILDKPHNDADSLFVLDTYQGNTPRAVTTLSGGETFTISLALALALSDLASRNVRIESLFIDEGFGTLDPDSLEIALGTLERLQSDSQKIVGVISHRHEMKDRIPVQIQVEKGTDGTSKVVLVGG